MKKLKKANIADVIIRAFFFFAFPAVWISGFSGIKYLCEQIHSGKPLEMNAFLVVLIILVAATVLLGRFFCGKACAFGTYGDVLYAVVSFIRKKMKKKAPALSERVTRRLRYLKFAVLVIVCAACIMGYAQTITAASPWAAFSYLTSMKFDFKNTLDFVSLALFIICSAGMMIERRFFCRFLCPLGAVFSLLPVMPFSLVRRKKSDCISGCSACKNICPAKLDLPYSYEKEADKPETEREYQFKMGECFQCGRCTQICPKRNAGCLTMPGGTKGIIYDFIKAAILAGVLWYFV